MSEFEVAVGADLRSQAYFALAEAYNLLQLLMDEQLRRDGGVTYVQFVLLAQLAQAPQGRLRMTDLADTVLHSRSGLTYQATRLEAAGLLRRERSEEDERSVTAVITDEGRRRLEQVIPGHQAVVQAGMFDVLSDNQVKELAEKLDAIRTRLRSMVPSSAQRRRG
ncbi:MarR family winged helix-turn-helix transcriptional regulator [Gryllotalpicola koreensis]|uniref:MarR family transcriptional regulator n=1 Tax=Gryllotalpicola koreensis TaxID=993086 RepID=A0ABP7ZY45_9MICO